ncbi:nebulin-related-anchoring protein isoform X5 [Coturnix japonica]|uniref:nebulin-related-anchoring protein isoform X5 n=1 Tax=Coturnix japonica TaxID=93934 RepID=UPI000776F439|nr:nebulin-related-anchoring protein isoform X5 [Coturnix japonica]
MNVQPCARCGYGVYPAEKINCIDQTWHKACFHCEVCKMMLTVNNFVSHEKKPYCQVHNPKNNAFTSIFETPINLNAKKLSEVVSEVKYREESEQFKSAFQWDARSRDIEAAYRAQHLASQNAYYAAYEGGTSWYSGNMPDPQMVRITQAQKTLNDIQYTEEYELRQGKGSFPAMITPGYQVAKRATQLSSNVEYKRGHEERVSKFTSVADTPDILHAKAGGQLASDLKYTEDFEEQRGKGSFPAMITPAYQIAKRANELASDVKYHQMYEKEIKGKASHTSGTDVTYTRENTDQYGQDYMNEYEEPRGKGSFPAMITPAYQNAKKANELASDIKYKKDLSKMKGAAHFHSLTAKDNLVLKQAQSANKLVSEVEYKKDLGNNRGYSINYCDTPQFKNVSKISKYTSDIKYKETYQNQMKGHYMGTGMDKRMLHAMKVGNLASNIAYKSDYKHDGVDYNYPATLTPSYQTTRKLVPLKDVNYRQSIDKMKYSSVASTPQIAQAKINAQQLSDLNYRAQYEKTKTNYTLPQDIPQLVKAKANAELYSEVKYKEGWEKSKGQGFEMKLDSLPLLAAKASRDLASDIKYKEEYEKTKGKAIETKDSRLLHSLQVAKMSSEIAYKKDFEESKTHFHLPMDMVNLRHAKKAQALASDLDYRKRLHEYTVVPEDMKTKWAKKAYGLQSDLQYRADLMWMKGVGCITEGSLNIQQAKKAGDLVSEKKYRQKADALKFTSVADSSHIKHAKKSQELQSDNRYRADLNWMKGAGWIATGSLNVEQAKKAGELISEKKYRQHPYALKFTSIKDTPEMIQARISYNQAVDRLYKEHGESVKHQYTLTTDLPEILRAKLNAMNISENRYKESWKKMKDGGYQLRLDAIPFQAAKASGEIISDHKYKEAFEKMKGQMIGSCGLDGDIRIAHSVHASSLQSDVKYKQGFEDTKTHFHLPLDMINLVHARKAQSLVSEQEYRQLLHQYTSLTDDLRLQCAKNAYKLQSENLYRSDMNFMRGVGCITPGALEIEGKKKASELISESKYRQQPHSFKYTSVTDSPGLLHAKFSNMIANERLYKAAGEDIQHHYTPTLGLPEFTQARINAANLSDVKYRESWHNLRAQGYKLTMEALPFQTARASRDIASDYQYKHNFVMERGKHIGARSVLDDTRLLHCLHAAKLQSEQEYKKGSQGVWSQYNLPMDMVNLVHARKAQALASDQDYRKRLHEFTALLEDLKMKWAKRAHMLQSEHRYKSDLNFMKGVGWMALRSPQIESVKKAGELISETKYRQKPESLKFTAVVDSPDLIHAKNSYLQCNDRLYKAGDSEARHRYTLPPDHPDFIRARQNALHISEKVYKTSWEQTRASGYDFRIDAIPFQTAKASREIASDYKYREAFVRDRGQRIGFFNANDDAHIRHVLRVGKLQSDNLYRSAYAQNRGHFQSHLNQPGFLHAKRSQQLASNVNYKQPLHQYTCDPEQLNVKHAKQAYNLQSDVKYKSDLNWLRGIGWTPPGSYKVERARRAAELAYLREMGLQAASAQYGPEADQVGLEGSQQVTVNPDALEILQVKRRKMHLYK